MLVYGYFDAEKQIVINTYVLPFSQLTFLGWSCGIAFALLVDGAYNVINYAVITLFISAALHFHAFYLQYEAIIQDFNEALNRKTVDSHKSKRILIEALKFQVLVKE